MARAGVKDGRLPLWLCSSTTGWAVTRRGHAALVALRPIRSEEGWLVTRRMQPSPLVLHGHGLSCACCTSRDEVAQALGQLFQDRVRHRCGDFAEVALLEAPSRLPARAASLNANRLIAARYRVCFDAAMHESGLSRRVAR